MHLVQRALAPASQLDADRQVVLRAERRQFLKRRWRGEAEDGTEFGFDLESRLTDGCVIWNDGEKDYIVRQLPELVYELAFSNPPDAALIAWKVGNLHLPSQILDDSILILHDEAMAQLLEREGWNHTVREVIFNPMKAMAHAP